MDFFIARQPIFNRHKQLYAYELLYRGTQFSPLEQTSGNKATTGVLSGVFLTEIIEKIASAKPCFINFTQDLLVKNLPAAFPQDQIVIEILEDVPATPEIIAACQQLKKQGYTIALDDFIYQDSLEPLIELADIIKFDFRLSTTEKIQETLAALQRYPLKYLAEKVETNEEFTQAKNMGFTYFQGYFFCKPESIKIKEIGAAKINLLKLLTEINQAQTTLEKIRTIIEQDASLTYKLLRYINSSYFSRISSVNSVAQAIAYLGEQELRRYLTIILLSELTTEKPSELLRLSLVRAEMCRLLARQTAHADKADELFLLGMFSLLDAMLDVSMENACKQLSLGQDITDALRNQKGPYAPFLDIVISYEQGDEAKCTAHIAQLDCVQHTTPQKLYLEAIHFAATAFY